MAHTPESESEPREETTQETVLLEILYQLEATNEVVRIWEYQRMRCRDIITNALIASIRLGQEPDYHVVLRRIADVLNVALGL